MVVRPLRALLAFHRRGTIAAAAEDVHLSAAAVSAQLKLLEEHLGGALFERTKRSIRLTHLGHRVVPMAEKVLAAYEELLQGSGSSSIRGRISLGVVNGVLTGIFPEVVQRVLEDSPGMEIKVSSGTSPDLVAKVAAGLLDAAVVNYPPKPLGDEFVVHKLYSEPIALIQPAGSAKATVADALRSRSYIALDRSTWAGRLVQDYLEQQGIDVEPVMELNSQEAILAAVRFGLGVSILPIIRGTNAKSEPTLKFKRISGLVRVISLVERKTHARSHMTAQFLSSFLGVVKGEPGSSPSRHPIAGAQRRKRRPPSE